MDVNIWSTFNVANPTKDQRHFDVFFWSVYHSEIQQLVNFVGFVTVSFSPQVQRFFDVNIWSCFDVEDPTKFQRLFDPNCWRGWSISKILSPLDFRLKNDVKSTSIFGYVLTSGPIKFLPHFDHNSLTRLCTSAKNSHFWNFTQGGVKFTYYGF